MEQSERDKLYLESYRMAKAEAAEALRARDDAQVRLDRANEACMAWKTIVTQAGVLPLNENVLAASPMFADYVPSRLSKAKTETTESNPDPEGKTGFVRQAIRKSGKQGISPGDVKAAAIKAGVKVYSGFPYTVIYKLKERGEIEINDAGLYVSAS